MSNMKPQDQKPCDENGNRHGEWIAYWDNGQLDYRWNYIHDIAHGLCEGYNKDGTLMYRGYYNMGKNIGYWYFYEEKHYNLCLL